jgi:hypothetical protein
MPEIQALAQAVAVAPVAEVRMQGPGSGRVAEHQQRAPGKAPAAEAAILVAGRQGDAGLHGEAQRIPLEKAPLQIDRGVQSAAVVLAPEGVANVLAQPGLAELQVEVLAQAVAQHRRRLQLARPDPRGAVARLVDHQLELKIALPLRAGILGEQRVGGLGRRDETCRQDGGGHACSEDGIGGHGRHSTGRRCNGFPYERDGELDPVGLRQPLTPPASRSTCWCPSPWHPCSRRRWRPDRPGT